MTMPVRLQLSRKAGFDLQAHSRAANGLLAVNCARPGPLGNPFVGDNAAAVAAFEQLLTGRCEVSVGSDKPIKRMAFIPAFQWGKQMTARFPKLRGMNLACWCSLCPKHKEAGKPLDQACPDCAPCHTDIIGAHVLRCEAA